MADGNELSGDPSTVYRVECGICDDPLRELLHSVICGDGKGREELMESIWLWGSNILSS